MKKQSLLSIIILSAFISAIELNASARFKKPAGSGGEASMPHRGGRGGEDLGGGSHVPPAGGAGSATATPAPAGGVATKADAMTAAATDIPGAAAALVEYLTPLMKGAKPNLTVKSFATNTPLTTSTPSANKSHRLGRL